MSSRFTFGTSLAAMRSSRYIMWYLGSGYDVITVHIWYLSSGYDVITVHIWYLSSGYDVITVHIWYLINVHIFTIAAAATMSLGQYTALKKHQSLIQSIIKRFLSVGSTRFENPCPTTDTDHIIFSHS